MHLCEVHHFKIYEITYNSPRTQKVGKLCRCTVQIKHRYKTYIQYIYISIIILQGAPLPVISKVITPLIGVFSPQLPIYFRAFFGASCPSIYNDRLVTAHLLGNKRLMRRKVTPPLGATGFLVVHHGFSFTSRMNIKKCGMAEDVDIKDFFAYLDFLFLPVKIDDSS